MGGAQSIPTSDAQSAADAERAASTQGAKPSSRPVLSHPPSGPGELFLSPVQKVGIKPEGYSAFEHTVAGLALSPETLVAIVALDPLSLYCDASGNEREPITVVGGVIATVGAWNAFRLKWQEASVDGIKIFHANDFAHSRGEFARGWKGNEGRRGAFAKRLLRVLATTVKCWTGIAVRQSEFDLFAGAATPFSLTADLLAPMAARGLPLFGCTHRGYFRTVDDLASLDALRAEFISAPPRLPFL